MSKKAEKKVAVKPKAKAKAPAKTKAPAKSGPSVTKYVKARMAAGVTNIETILEGVRKGFPKTKVTPGYIRHIARHIVGKPLAASHGRKAAGEKAKPKAAKPKATKPKAESKAEVEDTQSEI